MNTASSNTNLLYSLSLRLDFRDKQTLGFKRLVGILITYLFSNFVLSYGIYNNFNEAGFIIISMSTNIFLLSFVILNDFVNLFLVRDEAEVVYSLPLKVESIFFAKFFAAYTFVAFYALAIIIPQAVFFYRYNESIIGVILFVVTIFLFNIFIISALIISYSMILRFFSKLSQYFIYLINILFLVYIFYSTSMRGGADGSGRLGVEKFDWIGFLPQTYFAMAVHDPVVFIFTVGAVVIVSLAAYFIIKNSIRKISANVVLLKRKSRKKKGAVSVNMVDRFMSAVVLRNNFQRASYFLMKDQLSNSRVFKMRYYIFFFMPIVFAVITVFSDIPGTVNFKMARLPAEGIPLLNPSLLFTYILCARLLVTNTGIADTNSNDILWLYKSLPLKGPVSLRMGVLKFISVYFLIPIVLLMALILSIKTAFLSAFFNLAYVTAGIFFISAILYRLDRSYPFSIDSSRMDSSTKFLEILFSIVFGIIIFISMLFVFKSIIFIIISVFALLLAGGLILKTQKN